MSGPPVPVDLRPPATGPRPPWPGSARVASLALAGVALAGTSLAAWRLEGAGALALLALAGLAAAALALSVQMGRLARAEAARRAALQADGETLKALLGATGNGVVLADPTLRVRRLNPAAELLFGRSADETLGLPVDALIPELRRPGRAQIDPGEDPARPRVRELRGLRGGEEFPLRLLLRDLALGDGTWLLILAEDQTEGEHAEARLEYLERHDALTGLANRRAFEQALHATAADPELACAPHALCLIDLDRFKAINDACGHAAGDKLLRQVARILSTKLAEAACIARLGADELAVLFAGEAADRARPLCEDLVRTLRSFPFTWGERSFDLSASAGLVEFRPVQGAALALGQADIACQVAKTRGGDRLQVYDSDDAGSLRRRGDLDLVSAIGSALDEGRFRAIAQPIRSLRRGDEPPHYEILVRMRDDRGNPVAPDHFIPAAERYILMPAVDRWIISNLLEGQAERLRAWHARHPDRFLFAVNLSATTLMDESFLPFLKRRFEDHRVPYPSVCFEITETAAVADLERARAFMQALCDLGSSFSVDDFGTGFASYSYLKALPLRYLKIDGSFVRHLLRDPVDRALTESINHIGQVLGLETIAEWAETPELVEALKAMGVDYAQGYGVGQPVALDDLGPLPGPGH